MIELIKKIVGAVTPTKRKYTSSKNMNIRIGTSKGLITRSVN